MWSQTSICRTMFTICGPFCGKNDGELELPEELATHVRMVPWHEHSSDVVANGISKASGVEHVLEHENLKPVNAMMFGDGPNDMEILTMLDLRLPWVMPHQN